MSKLKPEDLARIKEEMHKVLTLRSGEAKVKITVHMGTCGIAAGARKVMSALLALMEEKNAKDVIITTSGCAGLCSREPMATVEIKGQPPVKYADLNEEKTKKIFEQHVLGGQIVKECAFALGSEQVL